MTAGQPHRPIAPAGSRCSCCASAMLMIVLDATVVNVALPSIQERPRLLAVEPRLGRQRVPDRVRRPAAAGRPARRPGLAPRRSSSPASASSPSPRSLCGVAQSQEMLVAARFVQGVGGAMTSAVDPRHDRDDVPRAARAGEGDRRLRFVASAGGSIGLLAGGVLTQAINWHWIFFVNVPIGDRDRAARPCACSPNDQGIGFGQRRRRARRGADHRRADAARLHDRQAGRRGRLGRRPHARARRRLARAARRLRRPRGDRRNPLIPLRIFRSRNVAGREPDPGR